MAKQVTFIEYRDFFKSRISYDTLWFTSILYRAVFTLYHDDDIISRVNKSKTQYSFDMIRIVMYELLIIKINSLLGDNQSQPSTKQLTAPTMKKHLIDAIKYRKPHLVESLYDHYNNEYVGWLNQSIIDMGKADLIINNHLSTINLLRNCHYAHITTTENIPIPKISWVDIKTLIDGLHSRYDAGARFYIGVSWSISRHDEERLKKEIQSLFGVYFMDYDPWAWNPWSM